MSPTATTTEHAPYHLSPEQVRFFDENGYLILRQWIPQDLLERLQKAGTAWIEDGLAVRDTDPGYVDYQFAQRSSGRVLYSINYLHNKGQPASLELLGSPAVLGVAESLCGANLVPTYESMVFKQPGDGAAIPWHQDCVHPRRRRIFNFDVYLDRALQGHGALRVLPGTQRGKQDICQLTERYGWDAPGVLHVEMEPGDVLLHDVMVVHGSERVEGKGLRRTIYYEFRSVEEILEDGPWDRAWIDRRLRLIPLGLERHRQAFPGAAQFDWQVDAQFRPRITGSEDQELRVAHTVHLPSSVCSAGDAGRKS